MNSYKQYGDHCRYDSDCKPGMNYVCSYGSCVCKTNTYFIQWSDPCGKIHFPLYFYLQNKIFKIGISKANQLSNLETCSNDNQCCCGQYCISNACQCTNDRFWSSALTYCRKFKTF